MIAQIPAEGIMKISDHGISQSYAISCMCADPDDTLQMYVQADDFGVSVNHVINVRVSNSITHDKHAWFHSILYKIRLTYRIWATGQLRYTGETIMTAQQTVNYAETLVRASKDVAEFSK